MILAYFSSRCGCAVAKLEKKDYAPGESGTIKVTYTAPRSASTAAKHIYVSSNDKANPRVRLTIKAKVVQMVQADPARLDLSLRKKNLGLNEITIQSLDARDSTPPHYYWVIAAWVRDQILPSLNLANMRLVFCVFSLEIRDVI